ncbi:MAG: DUF420 domain-containing protein [Phycisphaerae bacterium]
MVRRVYVKSDMVSPLKLISAFVCFLLVLGLVNRRRKRVHMALMTGAIAIDVSMVLYLEIARHVVESIPTRDMTPLLLGHVILSTVVLILYGIQVVSGVRNARGRISRLHPQMAVWTLVLRFGNLVTSWLVV